MGQHADEYEDGWVISSLVASRQESKSHLSLNEYILEDGTWKLRTSGWKAGWSNPPHVQRKWVYQMRVGGGL